VSGEGNPAVDDELMRKLWTVRRELLSESRSSTTALYSVWEPRTSLNAFEIVLASPATAMKSPTEKPNGTGIVNSCGKVAVLAQATFWWYGIAEHLSLPERAFNRVWKQKSEKSMRVSESSGQKLEKYGVVERSKLRH